MLKVDFQIPLHHTGGDAVVASHGDSKPSQSKKLALYCAVLVALGLIFGMFGCLAQDSTWVKAGARRRLFGHALRLRPLPRVTHQSTLLSAHSLTPVSGTSSLAAWQKLFPELAKLEEENADVKLEISRMQSQDDQLEFPYESGKQRTESQLSNTKYLDGWNIMVGFGGLAILALGIRRGLLRVSGSGSTALLHVRPPQGPARCAVQMSVAEIDAAGSSISAPQTTEKATVSSATSSAVAPQRVVVVGGGWAGYTAAESLASSDAVEVVLLEASPKAAGGLAGGWRTPSGRPVEAGIHGFWREYKNTFAMLDKLGLDREEVLTPYVPSALVSKNGPVAIAPVLAADDAPSTASTLMPNSSSPIAVATALAGLDPAKLLELLADLLPAPLDTALLAEFSPTSQLTLTDRASAIGLLAAWADFVQEDPDSWQRYDDVSAETLFKEYGGVSDTLYDELVAPLLHVLPMGPGSDISAAAALSCFHVFALQSRGAFDVRWCRGGITEKIFAPWQERLEAKGNVRLQGGARVSGIERSDVGAERRLSVSIVGEEEPLLADAVILAVGATSAARLTNASPLLSSLPSCDRFDELRGITCVAVRLYLKANPKGRTYGLRGGAHDSTLLPPSVASAMRASPVTVVGPEVGNLNELKETGFCVYDLQRMHDEHASGDLGVLEVDFYRADAIAEMSDDEAAEFALNAASKALGVDYGILSVDLIVDRAIVRARNAVSHFCLGSAALSPGVALGEGVYACGDWIDRSGHASWSTEKAVVTGKQAAQAVGRDLGVNGVHAEVIPVAEDTVQLAALRKAAKAARSVDSTLKLRGSKSDGLPPPAPWAFLRRATW